MGNAPGNARGQSRESERSSADRPCHGKCHRKQTAAKVSFCDGRQGKPAYRLSKALLLVRVKRWSKSPPLVWQQARLGKPRVVQGQIGGESRPGSLSGATETYGAPSNAAQA